MSNSEYLQEQSTRIINKVQTSVNIELQPVNINMELFEQQQNEFAGRHIGPNESETKDMLATIGLDSIETLISKTIPDRIRIKGSLALPQAMSEFEYINELRKTAAKNKIFKSYIGQGYYDTITPAVVLRNVFENAKVEVSKSDLLMFE